MERKKVTKATSKTIQNSSKRSKLPSKDSKVSSTFQTKENSIDAAEVRVDYNQEDLFPNHQSSDITQGDQIIQSSL